MAKDMTIGEYAQSKNFSPQYANRQKKNGKIKVRKCECGRTTFVINEPKKTN